MYRQVLKRYVSVLIMSMACLLAVAQGGTAQGIVKDNTGEPMIGVNVIVKGTTNGTITGLDGDFMIPGVNKGDILVFSYIGYKTQEVPYNGQMLNVLLEDDSETLEEVVVIGYGTVSKRDLTGSVASVSADAIAAVPVSSASEALTGKLPGVNITTTEGSPDADIKIRVRGGGSLSQDNSPLYIVDGFPVSSISDIAPSEIKSIDVLKDASSTAIYGARGANGVIIVTTKSGSEGKTQVDFNASYGFKKVTKFTKMMSPYDYAAYQYELGSTDYGNYQDLDIWKSIEGTDYQDEIFGRTGHQTQYNVNVSGGSKQLKFNVGFAHNDEKSIMLGSGFNKDNVNAKINAELNDWLSLDFQARLAYTTVDGLSGGADTNESNAANSIVANAARWRPVEALSASNEDEETSSTQKNPLERLNATYKTKNTLNQTYNVGLNWKPFDHFTFRTEFGYTFKNVDTDQVWGSDATQNSSLGYSGQPQAVLTRNKVRTWRNSNTLTYDNRLFDGRDKINVLIGQESSSSKEQELVSTSVSFPSSMTTSEILANMGAGTALANSTTIDAEDNMLSFFGRVNYTYNDKYLLTVTVRADGSSKFSEGNRWGLFPSAALAWRLSDENFMESTRDWLSQLKVRLSFGTAGNNRIDSGLMYTTYTIGDASGKEAPYFNGTRATLLENSGTLSNPDLTWETTITRNLGFDYGLFNNRISGSIDLYWNTTKDLLMKTTVPSNTGYSYQYQNFGKTSNKGIEFSASTVLIDNKKASLNFNFNIAWNKNKIDELNTDSPWQSSNWAGSVMSKYEDYRVEEGGSLGEIWGYKVAGYYTAYDATTNPDGELVLNGTTWELRDGLTDNSYTITGGSLYPGGLKLELDENGDPLKQKLGNTVAPVTGGFGFDGQIGNFDFNVFCNYSIGNKLINGTKLATAFYRGSSKGYNLNSDFALSNRYTWIDPETGLNLGRPSSSVISYYGSEEALIQRLNAINSGANIYNPCAVTTLQLIDYAVENASFLRINNVTVGYTLPKAWAKKCFAQRIRIYVTGYNLFCITGYSGADPEVDTSSKKNAMCPGVDYAAYPKSRTFVGGVNISF